MVRLVPETEWTQKKLVRSAHTVHAFVSAHNLDVSIEQSALLIAKVYDDPANAQSYLENMAPFFA